MIMLKDFDQIIASDNEFLCEEGILKFCNFKMSDFKVKTILAKMCDLDCVLEPSYITDLDINEAFNLELDIHKLQQLSFYLNQNYFLNKNKYQKVQGEYHISENKKLSKCNIDFFIEKHIAVLDLIDAIETNSKYNFNTSENKSSVISYDDTVIIILYNYTIEQLSKFSCATIDKIVSVLKGEDLVAKTLYLNELCDLVNKVEEDKRFVFLLENLELLYRECLRAYQFYLKDFSVTKLKIELDLQSVEFTQKIHSIINEAQTKLIAIPTAFILACAGLEFNAGTIAFKNIVIIAAMFFFSIIIQQFLDNQKSSLFFIEEKIESFKKLEISKSDHNDKYSIVVKSFKTVNIELGKQQKRLRTIEVILWFIPILLIVCRVIFMVFTSNIVQDLFISSI